MFRRRITATVAGAVALGLFATACSGPEESTGGDSDGESAAFSYRMPGRFADWLNDLNQFPVLQEEAGVEIELVDGGGSENYYQQIDLDLTSEGLGDAAIVNLAQMQVYGPQGALIDLAPLLEEQAPNVAAYLAENEDFRQLVTNEDGQIFGLIAERPSIGTLPFYRADMLAEAGVDEPPNTVEEFADALRALKETYGEDSNYYPMTGRDFFINMFYAFDAGFSIDEQGTLHGVYDESTGLSFNLHAPRFEEMIAWYKDLYDEGLIDPIWVQGSASEEDWQAQLLNGQASVSRDFFTRPSWFMQNGGPENDPDFQMDVLPAFETADGEQLTMTSNARFDSSRVFAIDARSENVEEVLGFLDYLYSDEGQRLLHYGVEGESYEMADGEPQYLVEFEDVAASPVGTPVWAFHQDRLTFPAPVDNAAYYDFLDDFTSSFAQEHFSENAAPHPVIKYSPEQLEERLELKASMQPAMVAGLTAFVTGERPLSEWSAFVEEMDEIGRERMAEIDQEAYDAMQNL